MNKNNSSKTNAIEKTSVAVPMSEIGTTLLRLNRNTLRVIAKRNGVPIHELKGELVNRLMNSGKSLEISLN